MRYSGREVIGVVCELPPGLEVTIEVIDILTDELIELEDDVCVESEHIGGIYRWSTDKIKDKEELGYKNLLCSMVGNDGTRSLAKLVIGGTAEMVYVLEDDITVVKALVS